MLRRVLDFYTRYLAIWVLVCGALAYKWDRQVASLKPGMDWFFALTMFGIGMVLQAEDFKRIIREPWVILIGSVAQFTIMPLGAFALARLFGLPDILAIGLILTGSAPGAMASNVMSYVAKADTAYSVSLTTVSTLLCPILTPALTYLLARSTMDVPFWNMLIHVFLTVIAPLLLGLAVRHRFNRHIRQILPVFPALSVTFIVFICSLVIALNKTHLAEATGLILLVVVVLNVYGMLTGYGVGTVFGMRTPSRRTLAIEIGMQNAGLGTILAIKHFGDQAAMPAAIFVFVCIITASITAAVWHRTGTNIDVQLSYNK